MENENEFLPIQTQEIHKIPDKTLAMIFVIVGAAVMIVCPLVIPGLFGWVLSVLGLIFVFLGICGFVSVSMEAKRFEKKN